MSRRPKLREQLLSSQNDGLSCLLEAVASTGWLAKGPHLQPHVAEQLDVAWDVVEKRLDGGHVVSGASPEPRLASPRLTRRP